jgi:regulator of replication initiation timing
VFSVLLIRDTNEPDEIRNRALVLNHELQTAKSEVDDLKGALEELNAKLLESEDENKHLRKRVREFEEKAEKFRAEQLRAREDDIKYFSESQEFSLLDFHLLPVHPFEPEKKPLGNVDRTDVYENLASGEFPSLLVVPIAEYLGTGGRAIQEKPAPAVDRYNSSGRYSYPESGKIFTFRVQ